MFVLGYNEESNQFSISKNGESLPGGFSPVEEAESAVLLHMVAISCRDSGCQKLDDVHESLDLLPVEWPDIDPFGDEL